MKAWGWGALFALLVMGCTGTPPAPNVRLKVEELKKHGHEVVDAIIKADINNDGYIEGSEWFLLSNEALAFYIKLAGGK